MNIGIMGGTFNPVHSGHIAFLHAFIHQIGLDICYVIPARRSPFRMNEPLAEDIHRLNMLHLACDHIPNIIVSDMEIRREGLSYTIDTVSEIQHAYPDALTSPLLRQLAYSRTSGKITSEKQWTTSMMTPLLKNERNSSASRCNLPKQITS